MTEVENFVPGFPLKSPDDYPNVPFKKYIKTSGKFGIVKPKVYCKDDPPPNAVVPGNASTLLFYRFPHWFHDILDLGLKTLPAEKFEYIYCLLCDLYYAWNVKENIIQTISAPPEIRGKNEFQVIGTNQVFSAAFLFSGKKNKPRSLRLYLYCSVDAVWTPQELCFPSHNGVVLVDGKLGFVIVCKAQLRYYALTNTKTIKNEPEWIHQLSETATDEWLYEIRAGLGMVALGLPDGKVQIFISSTGHLIRTVQPKILPCIFALTSKILAVGSDESSIEFFRLDSEETEAAGGINYAITHKTVSKKKIVAKKNLISQLQLQGNKVLFSVDDQIFMDDRSEVCPGLRIMEQFPVVAMGLVANMVVLVQSNGNVFVSGFGERTTIYSTKVTYDVTKPWKYNVQYISGTITHINVLFPDGQVLSIEPKLRIIEPEPVKEKQESVETQEEASVPKEESTETK